MKHWYAYLLISLLVFSAVTVAAFSAEKTLTIAHNLDPFTFNPFMTTTAAVESVILPTVEKLAYFAPGTMDVTPWLLRSWEYLNPTTIQLNLHEGVFFTNGEPFDAQAVKFSIEAWMEQPVMAQASMKLLGIEFNVVDETTLVIRTPDVVPMFLTLLGRYGYMVPPKYYAEVGPEGFGLHPIGTGPYKFVSHSPDFEVVFEKNPSYWRGDPPIDRVVFRIMPEEISRAAAVETGEADIAYYLSYTMIKRLKDAPGVVVYSVPGLRKFIAAFNGELLGGEPLLDKRVALALNLAVDNQAIVDAVYEGQAVALGGQFALPVELGWNPDIPAFGYDPDRARELLREAGYPNGFEVSFAYPVNRYPKDKEVGEILSSYFQAIGLTVKQRPLEWGEYVAERKAQTLGHIFFFGLLFAPDLDDTFSYMAFGKEARGAPMLTWPQEWWDLYDKSQTESDMSKRAAIYQEMLWMDYETPYGVYLFAPLDFYATRDRVTGFVPREDQFLFLYDVDVSE